MKKTIMIVLLIAGLVVFGCLGSPNTNTNTSGVGGSGAAGSAGSDGSGSGSGSGSNPGGSGMIGVNPTQAFNSCNSDCTIFGEGPAVLCRVGCITDYAIAERSTGRCEDIYGVPRVDDYQLANTYYNGCLDQVGVARNSIEPCSLVRGDAGVQARKNACITAVASENRNPALCSQMMQADHDSDPMVQEAYDRAFTQTIRDCEESAQ